MRKFLIPAAILISTLATAAPAAAQWAQPGYGYGYNNQGQVRHLVARVMQLRREIAQLDRRDILSNREARRLDSQARGLEYRVRRLRQGGIDGRERYVIERQIAQLEQRIRYQANDGNRRYGYNTAYNNNNRYGYGNGYNAYDRDRDGRDDRYEDDRGRRYDGRKNHERREDHDDDDDDD